MGPFNPLTVMKGSDASMTCSVDANPPATKIRWYKNNRLISHELNHTVVNVVPTDSGTFLCVSTHLFHLHFHHYTCSTLTYLYLLVVTNFLSSILSLCSIKLPLTSFTFSPFKRSDTFSLSVSTFKMSMIMMMTEGGEGGIRVTDSSSPFSLLRFS